MISSLLVATLAIATLATARSCSSSTEPTTFPDDGFVNFEPSVGLFPGPPAANADATFQFGVPRHWQWVPTYCPSPRLDYEDVDPSTDFPVTALDFTGVRYDWSAAGVAKVWIINEQTIGFADDHKRDRYLDEFSAALNKCGWEYDEEYVWGFNATPIELSGLPEGSVAYRSERNPWNTDLEPPEATFEAITVLVPGNQPNHLMVVTWTGWNAEVPAESAGSAAVVLAEAANDATRAEPGDDG